MVDRELDTELHHWDAFKKGERKSFIWLYDRYFPLLFNYGRKLGIGTVELEDAIQDLFVDLWRLKENLSSTTSVRFYLYRSLRRRIVKNATLPFDGLTTRLTEEEYLEARVPSSEQQLIENETRDRRTSQLAKLLKNLSPRQYEAMVLRFYDELTFSEIAAVLDMNEQSVRNLIQRGLISLREYAVYFASILALLFLLF